MADSDDPNENTIAERVFRTLQEDFSLTGFPHFEAAQMAVERWIKAYNELRPHASLGYLTPENAHCGRKIRALKWYPYENVRYGNIQYPSKTQPLLPQLVHSLP